MVDVLYFKLIAEQICEYFLFTISNAVATCFEPPYVKFPAISTCFPALTILPERPRISFIDFGFRNDPCFYCGFYF